ncbi:MAG: urease accessory protein, partial [Burkholderiaceae bacterium]|nr:urease accessory protein [Burkholderiaceae bacterium]
GLGQALETGVGIMLIVLGADVLRRLVRDRIHFHVHRHDLETEHVHAHSHSGEGRHADSPHHHEHSKRLPLRALAVGVMHGLAGSAALVVLSLQAVPSIALGLGYIALFGAGSILGMALLSFVIAVPLKFSAVYLASVHQTITALVGIFSCALGVFMVVEIGYLKTLLLA